MTSTVISLHMTPPETPSRSDTDASDLILAGRFREALQILSDEISRSPDFLSLVNRGTAYLNLGGLDKAIEDFTAADRLARVDPRGRTGAALLSLGVAYWLQDQYREACESWCAVVDGLERGEIIFTDRAGGIGAGALLWFGGSEDAQFRLKAERFLVVRTARGGARNWPGPIGEFLLGEIGVEGLERAAVESERLAPRRSCQAFFYAGAVRKESSESDVARRYFQRSVESGPLARLEDEYYLAGHELAKLNSDLRFER